MLGDRVGGTHQLWYRLELDRRFPKTLAVLEQLHGSCEEVFHCWDAEHALHVVSRLVGEDAPEGPTDNALGADMNNLYLP